MCSSVGDIARFESVYTVCQKCRNFAYFLSSYVCVRSRREMGRQVVGSDVIRCCILKRPLKAGKVWIGGCPVRLRREASPSTPSCGSSVMQERKKEKGGCRAYITQRRGTLDSQSPDSKANLEHARKVGKMNAKVLVVVFTLLCFGEYRVLFFAYFSFAYENGVLLAPLLLVFVTFCFISSKHASKGGRV